MSSIAVVANRKKLTAAVARDVRAALGRVGHADAAWIDVRRASAATPAAAKAVKNGADTVIACGGDGTVRAVAEALAGTGAALAVMPTGTANLFAGALRLPRQADQLMDLIIDGHRRTIDTGRCKGMTFNVMAGAGLDAALISAADRHKERLGTFAYLRAGAREARHSTAIDTTVEVDGTVLYDGPSSCVLVGNLGKLTGGLVAFPDASPHDGMLDVGVLSATGTKQWASLMLSVARRRQHASPYACMGRGAEITVRLADRQPFELDGGAKGRARRLRFRVEPSSLVVCAP